MKLFTQLVWEYFSYIYILHHSPTIKMLEALCCRGSRKASCKGFVSSAVKDVYVCVCMCLYVYVCVRTQLRFPVLELFSS